MIISNIVINRYRERKRRREVEGGGFLVIMRCRGEERKAEE